MAELFSASDLCSDGWVVRMWVRILAATVVLVSMSKTLYHNCFSSPRRKCVPVRAELVVVFDSPYGSSILPRELRWFQEWFMSPMNRGNNTLLALWFCLQSRAYLNARYYYDQSRLLTMSIGSQNTCSWIRRGVLNDFFHIQVWTFARFVRPLLATILCVWGKFGLVPITA